VGKRFQIAWDHTQDFFGRRALVVGLIPPIVWFLKWVVFHTFVTIDIILLISSYVMIGFVVLMVQFLKAGNALIKENESQEQIDSLTPQEQNELRRLVNAEKVAVGNPVLDAIALDARKARRFIRRDYDDWRIEEKYERFLKRWVKRTPPK